MCIRDRFIGDKGTATVKIDGKDAGDKATVTVKDQTILISFTEDSVKSDAGKAIEVTFKSKIRDGANLSAYIQNNGKVEIPNKASYLSLIHISFIIHSEEEKVLSINVKGPAVVTAADIAIDSDVEVVNVDQHIATVAEGGHFETVSYTHLDGSFRR